MNFYLEIFSKKFIKITLQNQQIADLLVLFFVIVLSKKYYVSSKDEGRKESFTINIKTVNAKTKNPGNFTNIEVSSTKEGIFDVISCFGSKARIYYPERYADIYIVLGDPLKDLLLIKTLFAVIAFVRSFNVHCACLKKDNLFVFFIGSKGVGKSTLANKLIKDGYFLIDDDTIYITRSYESIFLSSREFDRLFLIQKSTKLVLFVKKDIKSKTKVLRLTSKEALNKLILHADILFPKDDYLYNYRISVLEDFVKNSIIFELINGKDTLNEGFSIDSLIQRIINKGGQYG